MNIIIFSKNRPAQLQLLLRSMEKHLVEYAMLESGIKILFTYDPLYKEGYALVVDQYPHLKFFYETDFKQDLIKMVDAKQNTTMFLCDDDVFTEDVSFISDDPFTHFRFEDDIHCISLRLGKNLTNSYMSKQEVPLPVFDERNTWAWSSAKGDWGYPNSVSGHIYRTKDIIDYVTDLPYTGPNLFEGYMAMRRPERQLMICYDKSRCLSVPVNKVQTVCDNTYGQISAEKINKAFMSGMQISLDNISGLVNTSAHQEIKYLWESR